MYIKIRSLIFYPQGTCPTDDGMNVIPLPEMSSGREKLSWSGVAPSPISMLNSSDSPGLSKLCLSDFNIELGEGAEEH